ncbi:unnamed protein product [Acanthoscelides obtectus]|uniref:Uncharacterized protein n=1 Tax=Acanthoscelides obtectus TaxID=200917 RepID=A0A9P0KV44_ACAOB|nr:unnamed protein product [Acanthoscelides obtectus]CAK1643189.1 hypothetical protein AOBTE_LOCUS13439 [Acanthoscelides obtectus]
MNLQTFCVYMEPSYRSYAYSGSNAGPTLMGDIRNQESDNSVSTRDKNFGLVGIALALCLTCNGQKEMF